MSQNGMTVELLLEQASQGAEEVSQGPEEAAIIREAVEEAWQAIEQALIQLDHLPPALAWQVLLAPYGLQVLAPDTSAGPSPSDADAGGVS